MHNVISDLKATKLTRGDPTNKYQAQIKKVIKESTIIDENEKPHLLISTPLAPRIFGQIKIHKPDKKMRPVVDCSHAPSKLLSIFLLNFLKKSNLDTSGGEKSLRNSLDFVNRLRNVYNNEDLNMVSFDVKSMYSVIPIDKMMIIFKNFLQNSKLSNVVINELTKILDIIIHQNYFTFRGEYYEQIFGLPMGGVLSSFLANLYMSVWENEFLQDNHDIRFWGRYVDDVYALVHKEKIENTFKELNNKDTNIQFEMENEENGFINFLDLRIERLQNSFRFEIYRKETDIGRYIDGMSDHSFNQKYASINYMIHRLISLQLDNEKYKKEENYIFGIAKANNLNLNHVRSIFTKKHRIHQLDGITTHQGRNISQNKWSKMTYIEGLSEKLGKILRNYQVNLAYKPHANIKDSFYMGKDRIESDKRSGIYKLNCKCGSEYIGQTKRFIKQRVNEHRYDITSKKENGTGFSHHVLHSNNINCGIDNYNIIKQESNKSRRNYYESIYILQSKMKMGSRNVNNLNGPYEGQIVEYFKNL